MSSPSKSEQLPSVAWSWPILLLGLGLTTAFALISWQSTWFSLNLQTSSRPILLVVGLFVSAFVLYLFAILVVKRSRRTRLDLGMIVTFAIVFRCIVWFSNPILEVDIYRYVWDGVVVTEGVSPFAFSPEQVKQAISAEWDPSNRFAKNDDLMKLVKRAQSDTSIKDALDEVNFAQVPTVYPIVSQAVFALAAVTTHGQSNLKSRILVMKGWLLLFDLATLFVVIKVLSLCQLPRELCVIYGWCPLVIKEIANSGHLDSIAVFLTVLAVYLLMQSLSRTDDNATVARPWKSLSAFLCLALGVGAKIFPIVLLPAFLMVTLRKFGLKTVSLGAVVFVCLVGLFAYPMLPQGLTETANDNGQSDSAEMQQDPSLGVATFIKYWEINDLLFMIVVENLRPESAIQNQAGQGAWFVLLPDGWRITAVDFATEQFECDPETAPFFLARALTSAIFLALAVALATRLVGKKGLNDLELVGEYVFLTIAWFWLLSPTQNPWYWLWALPFLPFCNSRAWYVISGVLFLYYTRFWFDQQFTDEAVLGTPYRGTLFFDFVVPWVEFAPFLIWLAIECVLPKIRRLITI